MPEIPPELMLIAIKMAGDSPCKVCVITDHHSKEELGAVDLCRPLPKPWRPR